MDIIDSIMHAIGNVESGGDYDSPPHMDEGYYNLGGKYQILEDNWASWAQNAGLTADAPYTRENQDIVARNQMENMYAKYGTPQLVASAWNGGAGGANSFAKFGLDSYEAGYVAKFNAELDKIKSGINSSITNSTDKLGNKVSSQINTTSNSIMDNVGSITMRVVYTLVGTVFLVGGFFLLFKSNTMILQKEGKK